MYLKLASRQNKFVFKFQIISQFVSQIYNVITHNQYFNMLQKCSVNTYLLTSLLFSIVN